MNNRWYLVLFLLLAVITGLYIYNKYQKAPAIEFDKLSLSSLNNEPFVFSSLKGKKIILSFGASWCPNCINELNDISKIKDKELADVEVVVISDESPEEIQNFKDNKNYHFTFLKLNQAFPSVGINSIPVSYIFNNKLELKKQTVGYIDWTDASTLEHLKRLMD